MTDGVRITINGSNFFSTQGIIATGVTSIGGSGTVTAKYTTRGYGVNTRSDTFLTLDVPITDNDGPVDLIKSGEGTLLLAGQNTFTGDFLIQQYRA